jgi:hypothetical protein
MFVFLLLNAANRRLLAVHALRLARRPRASTRAASTSTRPRRPCRAARLHARGLAQARARGVARAVAPLRHTAQHDAVAVPVPAAIAEGSCSFAALPRDVRTWFGAARDDCVGLGVLRAN